jgi:hypothetical protein
MYSYSVNIIGVILAVAVTIFIGLLWYSPLLFGKKWMELVGMTPEVAVEVKKTANKSYAVMLIPAFVMVYILALFLKNMFLKDLGQAVLVGILLWLGFVATTGASEYIFNVKPKPWLLYVINVSYHLVSIIVGASILFWLR